MHARRDGCLAARALRACGVGFATLALSAAAARGEETRATSPIGDPAAAAAQALHLEAEEALASRTGAGLGLALRLNREAAQLDPAHARAHAGMAIAATLLALYAIEPPGPLLATARAAAAEALGLDPSLGRAHAAVGLVHYLGSWDAATAEAHLREAVRREPGLGDAWHWYGMLLYATARFDEAIAAFDRALALEPQSSLFATKRAGVLAAAGRGAEAEGELRQAVSRWPSAALPRRELGYLLVSLGREEEGLAMLMWAAELGGGLERDPDLAWGLARTGRRAEAESILAHLEGSPGRFVAPTDIALIHAGLGRLDEAFDRLEAAFRARDPGLVYLGTAPGWSPLRSDPRFHELVARVGLWRASTPAAGGAPEPAAGAASRPPSSGAAPEGEGR